MSYGINEDGYSGVEHNLWGGIKRAFSYIDNGLDACLFSVQADAPLAESAHVAKYFKNDHGNQASITGTHEELKMSYVFDLLTDHETSQKPQASDFSSFFNEFNDWAVNSMYVFLIIDAHLVFGSKSLERKLLLRLNRMRWEMYGPLPRCTFATNDKPDTLLHALATVSLFQFASSPAKPHVLNEYELLKRAADKMAAANVEEIGLDPFNLLHLIVNLRQLSILGYESRVAEGCIVIANPEEVLATLPLRRCVPLGEYRASRKAIETSTVEYPILSDGRDFLGLISREDLNSQGKPHAEIRFVGRNWWRWLYKNRVLFEIRDGVPGLPKSPIDYATFCAEIACWRRIDDAALKRIWNVVEAVAHSGHGAGVIVSAEAASEAQRLGNEGLLTEVIELPGILATQLSKMDGGILLDLDGFVHAFGIIVDGPACPGGDPGRGSRFNGSLRYVSSRRHQAFIFVVSTDGTIDPINPKFLESYISLLEQRS